MQLPSSSHIVWHYQDSAWARPNQTEPEDQLQYDPGFAAHFLSIPTPRARGRESVERFMTARTSCFALSFREREFPTHPGHLTRWIDFSSPGVKLEQIVTQSRAASAAAALNSVEALSSLPRSANGHLSLLGCPFCGPTAIKDAIYHNRLVGMCSTVKMQCFEWLPGLDQGFIHLNCAFTFF